jgi:hypothetical protein
MLDHTDALKANLKAQTFAQYVARYAGRWDGAKPAAGAKPASGQGPKVSALPPAGEVPAGERARAEATPPTASVVRKPEGAHKPVSARWHFPSADSIPAISIMTPEPKLPKATAHALGRDTARKEAIERRKVGKDPAHKESRRKDSTTKESKARESEAKKEAEKKRQEPGAPLQLTR